MTSVKLEPCRFTWYDAMALRSYGHGPEPSVYDEEGLLPIMEHEVQAQVDEELELVQRYCGKGHNTLPQKRPKTHRPKWKKN